MVAAVSMAALSVLSSTAEAAAPSPKDKQQAQSLVVEAKKLLAEGNIEKALGKYKKADQLAPQPLFKIEIAKIQTDLGQFVDALALLEEVQAAPAVGYHEKRAQLDAKKLRDALDPRVPKLTVDAEKPDAGKITLTIDEEDSEFGVHRVNPGKHDLVAKAKGFAPWKKSVSFDEGESKTVSIKMKSGDADEEESASNSSSSGVPAWAVWTSWGVSAAALGVGAGFGVMAIQTTNQVLADYGCADGRCPASAAGDLDIAKFNGNVSTASFAVGGAGLVTATVLTVLAKRGGAGADESQDGTKGEEQAAFHAEPLVGPGFLGVGGTF